MATLRELSEITGYSIATISRVLNEDETLKVTESTRKMILEAAGRAEYSNKHLANRKISPEGDLKVGIVEMDATQDSGKDPYYLYLKSDVEKCCFSNGMETFVMQFDPEERCYRSAVSRELDGILAIGQFREDQIAAMRKCSSKIVFVDSSPYPERFCSVIPDYEVGIRQGMDYLMEEGHRKIVFVGPEFSTDSTNRQALELRRKFFLDYLEQCKEIELQGFLLGTEKQGEDAAERVMEYVKNIKDAEHRPTAFFAFNETAALGVLRAIQIMGYQVPEDFSVLSYNDTVLATMTQPQMSGIGIHIEEMAENAVWLLERATRSERMLPLKIVVPSTLKVRGSVKPVYPF